MDKNYTVARPNPALSQKVAYTGTAGTIANALPDNCNVVRILSTTDCFVEITKAGTAAVADTGLYLVANVPEYFECDAGAKVSAIQVSTGGTIYVTPMV